MDEPVDELVPIDPYAENYQPYVEQSDPSLPDGFLALGGLFVGGMIIYLILTAALIALGIWIWYTITWRAVRRGLYEYHHNGYTPRRKKPSNYVPPNWR